MRKFCFLSVFLLIFFIYSATGFAFTPNKPEYQLLLSLVVGYANNKDMNNWAKEAEDYINWLYSGGRLESNLSKANIPVGFDIDFRYFFDDIGLGLQIGYHLTKAEGSPQLSGNFPAPFSRYGTFKVTDTEELIVVPVVATLYYRIDLESENSFVLLGGGIGYYFGTYNSCWTESFNGITINEYKLDGFKQSKIGFHALVEYDYVFGSGLTLFGGIKYRYVQFDELKKGGRTVQNVDGGKLKAGLTGVAAYIGLGYSF